jgi:hypothetical protein
MSDDIARLIGAVTREVRNETYQGKEAKVVVASRTYATSTIFGTPSPIPIAFRAGSRPSKASSDWAASIKSKAMPAAQSRAASRRANWR